MKTARVALALAVSWGAGQADAQEPAANRPHEAHDPDAEGFVSLFDGRTLEGWETPDRSWWSVEEGAITGRITPEKPCAINQYLVWSGGELADFELKLRSRLHGEGAINNGFQFRSRVLPDHDVCGYQVDNNLQTPWLVRLYDEYGRHTLAWRGERAVFDKEGARAVSPLPEGVGDAWFSLGEWHEYHLLCDGPRLTLRIDGRLAAEVEDHDPQRFEAAGALALQLHSGPPTVVQFKDIRLKRLPSSREEKSPAAPANDTKAALIREARAWWELDTGGHGATPPLRHIPAFEKFELNVRPSGPGRREGTKVALLDGAYFEAGPDLHGGDSAVTVYLRARDPQGSWQAALLAKGSGPERASFSLFGTTLPGREETALVFAIRTDQGVAPVEVPVAEIDARAWHDLIGRYDGRTLDLFCDGRRLASRPWSGKLVPNQEPLRLGADTDGERVLRPFRGEMQTAALWTRALSDEEIAALSREAP